MSSLRNHCPPWFRLGLQWFSWGDNLQRYLLVQALLQFFRLNVILIKYHHWLEDSCPKICPLNASVCVYIWGQNVLLSKSNYSQYNVTPRYFSVLRLSYQRGVKALLRMLIADGMLLSSKSLPFEFIVGKVINLCISCINTTNLKNTFAAEHFLVKAKHQWK